MAIDQEVSQLMKVESNGEATVPSLEAYGQVGPSGRPIRGAGQQSVTADGSMLLHSLTSHSAGAYTEAWQLIDGDDNVIGNPDWPGVRSAIISPDGKHVAFTAEVAGRRTYGVQTLAGQIVWQNNEDPTTESAIEPGRWINDDELWLEDISNGDAMTIDLDGTATEAPSIAHSAEDVSVLDAKPSANLEYYLGTNGQTVNLYDDESAVIMHPPDAVQFSGLWISDEEFLYLRLDGTDDYIQGDAGQPTGDPDLVSMSVHGGEPVLVIESFGADPTGNISDYADNYVHAGSIIAACG